jgi:predicted site-specific integrase-resolvase
MYNISEYSKEVNVAVKTLQRWVGEGKLCAHRTMNNRRYYTAEDVQKVLGTSVLAKIRKTVVYYRVSSAGQKRDLVRQKDALERFCIGAGKSVDAWVRDIGSGLNFKRKDFTELMRQVEQGEIKEIIIAHQDRLRVV